MQITFRRFGENMCKDCEFNKNCPCGYSAGNAACLTLRDASERAKNEEIRWMSESFWKIMDSNLKKTLNQ